METASPHGSGEHDTRFATCDWDRAGILEWRQPRLLVRHWELWADGELLAGLRHRGAFKRGLTAESASGRWDLPQRWSGDLAIRREGEVEPLALHRRKWWGGGRIAVAGGQELGLARRGLWLAEAVLTNREGFEYLRIRRRFSPPRMQASVELTESGRRLEHLEPLLMLCWAATMESHHHGGHH